MHFLWLLLLLLSYHRLSCDLAGVNLLGRIVLHFLLGLLFRLLVLALAVRKVEWLDISKFVGVGLDKRGQQIAQFEKEWRGEQLVVKLLLAAQNQELVHDFAGATRVFVGKFALAQQVEGLGEFELLARVLQIGGVLNVARRGRVRAEHGEDLVEV